MHPSSRNTVASIVLLTIICDYSVRPPEIIEIEWIAIVNAVQQALIFATDLIGACEELIPFRYSVRYPGLPPPIHQLVLGVAGPKEWAIIAFETLAGVGDQFTPCEDLAFDPARRCLALASEEAMRERGTEVAELQGVVANWVGFEEQKDTQVHLAG